MFGSLIPWTNLPQTMPSMRRGFSSLIDRLWSDDEWMLDWTGYPRCNLAETDTGYEVTLEMPGLKPEDFSVELKDNELWVAGRRQHEHEEQGKTFHRMERHYGEFRRTISLDRAVDPDKVEADYKDGVLTVKIVKSETAKPKRIEVKS